MLPWWFSEHNEEKEPVSDAVPEIVWEEPEHLTEEGRRKAWRLLKLLDALREIRPDGPVEFAELNQLGEVANGDHDLHDACDALRNGCSFELLVGIYT